MRHALLILFLFSLSCASSSARHERVAARRAGLAIICHRGASEFAHENTLEAYRATFELGGDGNEIDIRQTKDGVLVLFHDDMLDMNLKAFGDVSDYTWEELQKFIFRKPGPFGDACRIPTLKEVFELHKKYAGLMHLDIKVPNIDTKIEKMLDEMDMWEQISNVSEYNSENIRKNPRLHPRPYKGGIYANHEEVFPDSIAAVLKNPGDDVICDDPRGVEVALGRKIGNVSKSPLSRPPKQPERKLADFAEFMASHVLISMPQSAFEQTMGDQYDIRLVVLKRARAAEVLANSAGTGPDLHADLEKLVRNRTLHADWRIHGLDGAAALRTLILRRAPQAVELSRFVLWRDDPALIPLNNPEYKVPASWVDFRIKGVVFAALEKYPGNESEKLCRDYLALSDEEAKRIGPPQFEPAAHTLLTISPKKETAIELMHHRLQVVRGRAILDCLVHHNEQWALDALKAAAPHALAYIPPQ